MSKPRVIAFYLPQFYPTPENDSWWEPGFTEWTNVTRAKPLFPGHYQPRLPRDLGFYDLRVPEVREKQARMAKEAGIEGFCYWHYWFGNGRRLLSEVFEDVVSSGKPDFPFCLCWANHSWYSKTWDPTKPDKLLIEQSYPGKEDYIAHFYEMLPAFKDDRYMKTEDKRLIFGIFDPISFSDFLSFKDTWNELASQNGLKGFSFFAYVQGEHTFSRLKTPNDYDTVVLDGVAQSYSIMRSSFMGRVYNRSLTKYLHIPLIIPYDFYCKTIISALGRNRMFTPCINPSFDHSPRSGYKGYVLHGSTPMKWKKLILDSCEYLRGNRFLFVKAWNEWAEGNYLEPDSRFGNQYLTVLKESLLELDNKK